MKGKEGARNATESVDGKGQASQFQDVSGPQEETRSQTSEEDDKEVKDLLGRFSVLNGTRSVLMFAGGVVGLVTALT